MLGIIGAMDEEVLKIKEHMEQVLSLIHIFLGNMFPGFKFSLYNCIFNPKIDGIGNGGVLDKRLLFAHELGLLCFSNKSNNNYTLKNTKSQ